MIYLLLYFDEVVADVQQAKKWYKELRKGLENEFSEEIEKAVWQVMKSHVKKDKNIIMSKIRQTATISEGYSSDFCWVINLYFTRADLSAEPR